MFQSRSKVKKNSNNFEQNSSRVTWSARFSPLGLHVLAAVALGQFSDFNLQFAWFQGHSQKKLMTEAMSMEDLWLRQSVHGWVLFLGIKSVYTTKVTEITEASASVGLLLATAVDLKEDLVALSLSNLSWSMNTEVSDTLPLVQCDHAPPMVSLYYRRREISFSRQTRVARAA